MKVNPIWTEEGEWVDCRDGNLVGCCDCGLVHRVEYRVRYRGRGRNRVIQKRVWRHDEATRIGRALMEFECK
jgi:hypothetical protein